MTTREQQVKWGKKGALKQWGGISIEDRFWRKVDKKGPNDCWNWLGCNIPKGRTSYGFFRWPDRTTKAAHRVAYELSNGPIPKGKSVCHKCDNGLCCNPAHLWVGTQYENMRDCINKGRFKFPNWPKHKKKGSKYSVEFVEKLKKEHVPFVITPKMLAEKYGISKGAIRALLWRSDYITDPNWKWS